jgi:pimeloyl-ACP methyl ester carboxylesterase
VRQLRRDLDQDALHGPLVLVGHSAGGRAALFAAQQLESWNVTVDLVICVDVAYPPQVPGNVKRAVNLYRSQRRIYPAGSLVPAPGSKGAIHNLDLDSPTSPIKERGLNHLNITSSPGVQSLLLDHIRDIVSQSL